MPHSPEEKLVEKIFLGEDPVKFGHFAIFSYIYFRAKCLPQSWLRSYA